jgi:outer membrane protein assembly factor BamD (BamD/ComL family)
LPKPKFKSKLLVLLLLMGASGCAYFNTYTNARKSFKEAEAIPVDAKGNLTAQARRGYDGCVTKCQKLIDEFPDSRWVDDGLFLMSKSYFRKREFGRCLMRLDELDERFPVHSFSEEVLFLRGISHLEREEESRAIAMLAKLEEQFPSSKHLAEGIFRSAEAEYRLGNWPLALEGYARLLDRFEYSEWNDEARLKRGRIFIELEDHASAVEELGTLAQTARKRGLAFDGQMMQVESLIELLRFDEADEQLDDMESVAENFHKRAQVLLLRALVLEKKQDFDPAIQLLEDVASEFINQVHAAEAWYRIGLIRQIHQVDPEAALEAFEKSVSDGGHSIFRDLAGDRKLAIEDFLSARESASSAEGDSSQAEAHFRLAENQFLRLEDPDSALEGYRKVLEDFPDSPWAPRAAYALCYIHRYSQTDSTAAILAAERLLTDYPDSKASAWVKNWAVELGDLP